ncbi:MAG TPA: hypothetical protein VFA90_06915 [Terriglobales bacterium]|nr:hypothetical protein [Terriglobales bacterium]
MPTESAALSEIENRCDAIEECYEFMLGYAGKGLPSDEGSQVRYYLERALEALRGLAQVFSEIVRQRRLEPGAKYEAFMAVLERDSRDSSAAIDLVLAQPKISSQLIDNLNASIHLRALLTDIFLIDGIFRDQMKTA